MNQTAMTAFLALALVAFVAAATAFVYRAAAVRPPTRRKTGGETPTAQPDDAPVTAGGDDLGLFRRLLALETRLEQIETRFTDLKESTDRRFGRLNQARSRGTLPDAPSDEDGDTAQLPMFPAAAPPRSSAALSNGTRGRALIPRR